MTCKRRHAVQWWSPSARVQILRASGCWGTLVFWFLFADFDVFVYADINSVLVFEVNTHKR
jgi:hypothetical protein